MSGAFAPTTLPTSRSPLNSKYNGLHVARISFPSGVLLSAACFAIIDLSAVQNASLSRAFSVVMKIRCSAGSMTTVGPHQSLNASTTGNSLRAQMLEIRQHKKSSVTRGQTSTY